MPKSASHRPVSPADDQAETLNIGELGWTTEDSPTPEA